MTFKNKQLHVDSKSGPNPSTYAITQKAYKVENVGKTMKSSKRRVTWVFGCYARTHQVELHDSIKSGKKRLVVDGKTVFQTAIKDTVFSHMVAINNVDVQISKKKNIIGPDQYILKIDKILFQDLRMSSPRVKGSPAPSGPGEKITECVSPRNSPNNKLRSKIITVKEDQVVSETNSTGESDDVEGKGGAAKASSNKKKLGSGEVEKEEEEKEKEEEEDEEEDEKEEGEGMQEAFSRRMSRADTGASFNPFDDVFDSAPETKHTKNDSGNLLDFTSFEPEPPPQQQQFSSTSTMEKGRPQPLQTGQVGSNGVLLFSPTGYGSHSEVHMGMQQQQQQQQASPFGFPGNQGMQPQIASPQHMQHPSLQSYQSPMNQHQQQHQQQHMQSNMASPVNMSSPFMSNSPPPSPPRRAAPTLAAPGIARYGSMHDSNGSHASKMDQLRMMMAAAPSTFDTNSPRQQQHQQPGQYNNNNNNNNNNNINNSSNSFGSNNAMPSTNGSKKAFDDIDAFSHLGGDSKTKMDYGNTNANTQSNISSNTNTKTDYSFEFNGSTSGTAIPTDTPTNNNARARFNPFD